VSRDLRVALVGFGNVGRRFAELLPAAYRPALAAAGVNVRVTGIATARHGIALDPRGLPLRRCLGIVRSGGTLDGLTRGGSVASPLELIRRVPADVLVEVTALDPRRGQPATAHVRAALERGLDAVTANKGPVAFAARRLHSLARRRGRLFLHEGAVMDGTPVFNLVERCLPGARVLGFRGVLNSTTSHILARMEEGASAASALREMQAAGVAEADPRHDLDGWDAAVKGCALANTLMGASLRPAQVRRRGIGAIGPAQVRAASKRGRRIRLVVRGTRRGRAVRVAVAPEAIALDDPLCVSGPDAVLVLETDLMGEIAVRERGATVDQTAYALLSDLLAVAKAKAARGAERSA
jgi:homoserine dehydrogenase